MFVSRLFLIFCAFLGGCSAPIVRLPPDTPPAPETVTRKQPGGNAHDPHQAALTRLLDAEWGWRSDRDAQARFPLPDRKKWTRIRFAFVKHLVAFKYGEDYHAVSAGFVVPLKEGDPQTSAQCVARFEEDALEQVEFFGGKISEQSSQKGQWGETELLLQKAHGSINILFRHYDVSVAWTGYPAYPSSCMVYAVVVVRDDQQELADAVRDRWMTGFGAFQSLTSTEPYRH